MYNFDPMSKVYIGLTFEIHILFYGASLCALLLVILRPSKFISYVIVLAFTHLSLYYSLMLMAFFPGIFITAVLVVGMLAGLKSIFGYGLRRLSIMTNQDAARWIFEYWTIG